MLALLTLLACSGRSEERPASAPPGAPNVLLILVDDLRPDLGSYGHPLVESPNIDRLAARGVLFERAYSQFPVCNPSRASLLTGLRPTATGVLDNHTHYREQLPEVTTMPELFRNNGYFTASVGKVFHGAGGRREWADPEAWDETHFPRGRRKARGRERKRFGFASGSTIGWVAAGGSDQDQPDGQTAIETVNVLERALQSGRPFFLAAGFLRPHAPMIAPSAYFGRYPLDVLAPFLAPEVASAVEPALAVGKPELEPIEREDQLGLLRAYFACTTFVDAQIGRVFEALDRHGLWESTVVLLTSDHGIHLGERGWWSKNTLSEVSARVPLVVWAPDLESGGARSPALVELIDVYPSLAELAGLEPPPRLDGRSFVPLLADPDRAWKVAAFTRANRVESTGLSVRTERWRYTLWAGERNAEELYDHVGDPRELVNLVGEPEHGDVLERMRALAAQAGSEGAGG